ncbi:MAG: hypothetical protein ACT4P7_02365 [Gemmatimonadaceae bacterium]
MLFAVLQLSLPAALGVGDALAADNGKGNASHVEATSGTQCRPVHTADCTVCVRLATKGLASAVAPGLGAQPARGHPAATLAVDTRSISRQAARSRAPPALPV